jgi:hypothetical protein
MLVLQNLAGGHQMACFAAVQANRFDVKLQSLQAQGQYFFGRIGHWKQLKCGFVHAHIGGLG